MPIAETTVGSMNYHVLRTILEDGGVLHLGRGAEIGVLYADTSSYLLKKFPGLKLFCVDPYLEYDEDGADRSQSTMSQFEQVARDKLSEFGERAELMKSFSVDAAKEIPDQSLDFVFIDALHEYDAVKQDLESWYPKIRHGGLVSGHDYRWQGVGKAVQEFTDKVGASGFCSPKTSDVWFFLKP